jgi:two-component system, NarL family, response regulator DevR
LAAPDSRSIISLVKPLRPKIAVMLVDDSDLYRSALRDAVNSEDDLSVVMEARCMEEALDRVDEVPLDVAVVDRRLPDGDGIDLCHRLVSRHIPCVVLTASSHETEIVDLARRAGASALLQKGSRVSTLSAAIREAAAAGE